MEVQFTPSPQEDRRSKAVETTADREEEHQAVRREVSVTCRGLVRAGEEEEGVLPTASDEGQAEPCDSSLWCCSGDRLSLLLSSSNTYESSCFGNFPWFTLRGERESFTSRRRTRHSGSSRLSFYFSCSDILRCFVLLHHAVCVRTQQCSVCV